MTVGELLRRIPNKEFTEWMAYAKVEPFGDERRDFMLAQNTCMIYNANRGKGPNKKITDFLPFSKQNQPITGDAAIAALKKAIPGGIVREG